MLLSITRSNPFDSGWLILKGLQQMPDPIFYVQTFLHNFFLHSATLKPSPLSLIAIPVCTNNGLTKTFFVLFGGYFKQPNCFLTGGS